MKITENIHVLKLNFDIQVNVQTKLERFVNVIFIFGERVTLIDTGVKFSVPEILKYLKANGRDISELETIILSHSHPDHMGSAFQLKNLSGCKILAHQAEREWIENIDFQYAERPVPGFYNLLDSSVIVDEFIEHNQLIEIERDIHLKIYHAPGHSDGSVNILFVEDQVFFTADSIPLKGDIPNYTNFIQLMISLEEIYQNNDRYNILLTSWTAPIFDKTEMFKLMSEGSTYLYKVDHCVKNNYSKPVVGIDACENTLKELGLPLFLATAVVDNAFKSHLFFLN
jgi:hydroxyacylglutathione hydrolase